MSNQLDIPVEYQGLYLPDEEDTCRYTIVTGGRGSAKSFNVGLAATIRSRERGRRMLYTRYTMTSAHLSVIPEFVEKIELLNVAHEFDINKTDILHRPSGTEVLFRGIKTGSGNQSASLKSLMGITDWILDEAEELVDEDTFDKIDLSVRKKGKHNRVIIILNPTVKSHWIYERFFESRGVPEGFNGIKGNTRYIHTDYRCNIQNLDEDYVASLELMKIRRPEKYKHQILGSWLDKAEGVIITNWRIAEERVSNPTPEQQREYDRIDSIIPVYGQDFGFSIDISTLVETRIDKQLKRIYVRECFGATKMTTTDIYNQNMLHAGNYKIIGDSAEPRLITEVAAKGCNIEAVKKGKDSIMTGIALLQDYEIIVHPDSIGLIKELNNYVWAEKNAKPIDAHNHYIDALRYAVFYQLAAKGTGRYMIV